MAEISAPTPNPETQDQKEQIKRLTGFKALSFAVEFGFIIAIPLLAFGFLGKWLDHHYNHHFFMFIGIILALVTSGLWFYRSIKSLMKDLNIKECLHFRL